MNSWQSSQHYVFHVSGLASSLSDWTSMWTDISSDRLKLIVVELLCTLEMYSGDAVVALRLYLTSIVGVIL